MDFRELSYIHAIAENQSITRAAEALYITQPTLSKFLQQTEDILGQKLFSRIGKRYVPTYAGERYIAYATQILNMHNSMKEELSDIANERDGQLRIGFSAMRGSEIILNTAPAFSALYPHVSLHLEEVNGYTFEKTLLSGYLDIVFINLPIHSSDLDYEVIGYDPVLLVAGNDSPLREKAEVRKGCDYPWLDLIHVKDQPMVLPPHNVRLYDIVMEQLKKEHIAPRILFYTRNLEAASILASGGACVTFVINQYIKYTRFAKPPALFNIGSPPCYRTFAAVYRRGAYLPNYTKEMIKIAKAQLVAPV